MQALNDLTFGVEFEFIVRVPIAPYRAATLGKSWCLGTIDEPEFMGDPQLSKRTVVPSSIRHAVHLEIAQTLRDASIPCNEVGNPNDFSMWAVTHDNSIRPHKGQPPNYLGLDDAEVGVELKTRILPFSEKSLEEVRYALKVIKEKFQVRTNDSTGLHVHIGRDKPRDSEDIFALSTLKNLICLVTIFEFQIERIHPPCRINNFNCRPVRDCFPKTRSLQYALTQINAQCTISDLVALMSIYGNIVDMSGNSAYNLRQLLGGY
ncbi:MAG: hypothetical protein M1835_001080, partial [Candelina submexicana]